MAVVKISELVVAGALTGAELMEAVQGGVNKKVTIQDIANFAGPSFYSTNGQLASDRTVDLNGKFLMFQQGGNDFLVLDPTLNSESATIGAFNITDGGNEAQFRTSVSDLSSEARIISEFDGNSKEANITAFTDATTATIAYTADTHTFNIPVTGGFIITDGVSNLFEVDRGGLSSNLQATDGTVQTRLSMNANLVGNDVSFNLKADDGTNQVEITGDAQAQTITLTGANGTNVVGGLLLSYTAQTSTYPILRSDYTIDCTSGTFTSTLPTAVGFTGQIYNVKNSGAGVITIACTGGQTIDGAATKTVVAGVNVQVMSNGAAWIIL